MIRPTNKIPHGISEYGNRDKMQNFRPLKFTNCTLHNLHFSVVFKILQYETIGLQVLFITIQHTACIV